MKEYQRATQQTKSKSTISLLDFKFQNILKYNRANETINDAHLNRKQQSQIVERIIHSFLPHPTPQKTQSNAAVPLSVGRQLLEKVPSD